MWSWSTPADGTEWDPFELMSRRLRDAAGAETVTARLLYRRTGSNLRGTDVRVVGAVLSPVSLTMIRMRSRFWVSVTSHNSKLSFRKRRDESMNPDPACVHQV